MRAGWPRAHAHSEFRGRLLEPPYFEDLSERGAVKLTSLLRLTGRPHYTLWEQQIGRPHFKERTGQFIPMYYLDLEVTDAPIETREALEVEVRIRLGKHLGPDDLHPSRPRPGAAAGDHPPPLPSGSATCPPGRSAPTGRMT